MLWDAIHNEILIVLLIASVVKIVLGATYSEDPNTGWIEGVAILLTVAVVVIVTATNDYQKERQFQALQAKQVCVCVCVSVCVC